MRSKVVLVFTQLLISLLVVCIPAVVCGKTIGGWNSIRGGGAGILTGGDFAGVRADVTAFFPGTTYSETNELTSTFLNSLYVLLLDPVFEGGNVTIDPLTTAEQTAIASWVTSGGRALILGENSSYVDASRSMIEPFGPTWENTNSAGANPGSIVDHSAFPTITDGPFGAVNSFTGGFVSWFTNVAPATALGTWNSNNQVSLAAMTFGSGKVVFFGDNTILYSSADNVTLRRNTLSYLLNTSPNVFPDYNGNGVVDAPDYVLWRDTLGHIVSPFSGADADGSGVIDAADYSLWKAFFGKSIGDGSSNGVFAAVPEPAPAILLCLAVAGVNFSSCRANKTNR